MDVIAAPTPEPDAARGPITPLPSPAQSGSGQWRLIAVAALVVGVAIGAVAATSTRVEQPRAPDLETTLEWMFTASLTYSATTEDGQEVPPPARGVSVREVEILDPVRGPILAIVELDHTSSSETVAYEVTTRRSGRSWIVEATPWPDGTRPGGS